MNNRSELKYRKMRGLWHEARAKQKQQPECKSINRRLYSPLRVQSERASFFTGGVDLTNYRTNARRHLRPARSNAIRPLPPSSAPTLPVCLKVGQGIVNIRSSVPGPPSLAPAASLIRTTDCSHLLMDGVGPRSSERFGYHSPISARKAPARASERSGR